MWAVNEGDFFWLVPDPVKPRLQFLQIWWSGFGSHNPNTGMIGCVGIGGLCLR